MRHPTIPGSDGELSGNIDAIARDIGYPLMVKAAAGGGGKGMRVVSSPDDLESALEAAKNEARNSFGNDTLILEKFLDNPRHIEVQILGDNFGNIIPRRYQSMLHFHCFKNNNNIPFTNLSPIFHFLI